MPQLTLKTYAAAELRILRLVIEDRLCHANSQNLIAYVNTNIRPLGPCHTLVMNLFGSESSSSLGRRHLYRHKPR